MALGQYRKVEAMGQVPRAGSRPDPASASRPKAAVQAGQRPRKSLVRPDSDESHETCRPRVQETVSPELESVRAGGKGNLASDSA